MKKSKIVQKNKALYYKSVKLNWWQAGLFKASTISFGIILGIYFRDLLMAYLPLFWVLFPICGIYIAYIWIKE